MVYFCLQVSFNFVCKTTNIFTHANSKNFEHNFFIYLKIICIFAPFLLYLAANLFDVVTCKTDFVPLPLVTYAI